MMPHHQMIARRERQNEQRYPFPKVKEVTEQPGEYYAEAIHDGVKVYQKYSDNRYHEQEVIPFADVLIRADDGEWDDNRSLALRLLAEWGHPGEPFPT